VRFPALSAEVSGRWFLVSDAALPVVVPPTPPGAGEAVDWRADLALVVAAFAFGTTFVVVQDAVEDADPVDFLAIRFLFAALVLGVAARRRTRSEGLVRHGVLAGLVLGGGYVFQTIGLQYTTPATSAFLTYVLVLFVPILTFLVLRRRPHPATLVGIPLALVGLALLTGGGATGLGRGELLTLGCAFAFALHLVILGGTADRHDPVRFTFVQLVTVGVACLIASLAAEPGSAPVLGARSFGAAVFTGLFATAVAFLAMVWAQRVVSPSRAALILLLEPVFAALLAAVTGDSLTPATVAGGAFILVAVMVSEVVPNMRTRPVG
jgi:drug/metabolite transporter (DMT)-like permease